MQSLLLCVPKTIDDLRTQCRKPSIRREPAITLETIRANPTPLRQIRVRSGSIRNSTCQTSWPRWISFVRAIHRSDALDSDVKALVQNGLKQRRLELHIAVVRNGWLASSRCAVGYVNDERHRRALVAPKERRSGCKAQIDDRLGGIWYFGEAIRFWE